MFWLGVGEAGRGGGERARGGVATRKNLDLSPKSIDATVVNLQHHLKPVSVSSPSQLIVLYPHSTTYVSPIPDRSASQPASKVSPEYGSDPIPPRQRYPHVTEIYNNERLRYRLLFSPHNGEEESQRWYRDDDCEIQESRQNVKHQQQPRL